MREDGIGEESRKRKPEFGAYRGRFEIGPEFFEPLSPEDLTGWGG